jgi:hypothetical protein
VKNINEFIINEESVSKRTSAFSNNSNSTRSLAPPKQNKKF